MKKKNYFKNYFTVQDLIDRLQQIEDKSLPVYLEGCDCTGRWGGQIDLPTGYLGEDPGIELRRERTT